MRTLRDLLKERVVVLDGGMGTQILANQPTVDDFGGPELEGCVEVLNERRPEWIRKIHASYFDAGADAVETNTFGCNELVLGEFGIGHRARELNRAAALLARDVARAYREPKYVVGSVGPGTKLLTLGQVTHDALYRSYLTQMQGLVDARVDAILIETCQDLGQIKLAIRAARAALAEQRVDIPIWAQVTIEANGTMLLGSDIQTALAALEPFPLEVLGLNCATGPDEMQQHVAYLSEAAPMALSCQPNAGLPENVGGKPVYPLGPEAFAEKVAAMATTYRLNVVGGCCGTTPAHIRALAPRVSGLSAPRREPRYDRSVTSLYSAVPLSLEPKPLFVGERTNANGSKKFRECLAANDWDALVTIAKEQQKEGAHILDVCVAYVQRDEVADMREFVKRLATQTSLPLMIDSTEAPVVEEALRLAPGKCIVNSINFEDGEGKARKTLALCREYGAAVVALTIDEDGMAKSADRKVAIAKRLVALATEEFGLDVGDIVIDPLTFTLGAGDEEFRKSAIETLDAIERIKNDIPGVRTVLGLSNVSFGLNPLPRKLLNSLMLFHATKRGLDLAILNASKIVPVASIEPDVRTILDDLIFDRRRDGYDPLKEILARFTDKSAGPAATRRKTDELPVRERLKHHIIDGDKQRIVADALLALEEMPALDIINDVLLDGMRVVGERFGAGEMQLPFVLESAEAMKAAVRTLEPYLEKKEGSTKGRMILATVKGDVHDIGKNLVEIILSNNGFEVVNLGIKQPIETILERYKAQGADCIGMSGLLVKSTAIMRENLQYMASHGYTLPVVLGGAALTRAFVEQDCQAVYPGPVFYAPDAFGGLHVLGAIAAARDQGLAPTKENITKLLPAGANAAASVEEAAPAIRVVRKGDAAVPLDERGQSSWVRKSENVPRAPFEGVRTLTPTAADVLAWLDEFALVRSRWGFTQGTQSEAEFQRVLDEVAAPRLAEWKRRLGDASWLRPAARYGYFPAASRGDALLVYAPGTGAETAPDRREILATFRFPRQSSGRRLCIADFFRHEASGELDVLAVQLVTMGQAASDATAALYEKQNYAEYFTLHGLLTELTEACAELVHRQIRTELGVHRRDATNLRQLFSQGYQGSRYSFGYPACPDMEPNEALLRLLGGHTIGVTLSESHQMVPEMSTSAVVAWHPQARYFSV
jgi:5-methyltetrahydrofolate--homocysteine methyltransferase